MKKSISIVEYIFVIAICCLVGYSVFAQSGGGGGGSGPRITSEAQHPLRHRADRIMVDTSNFSTNLNSSADDLQSALDQLDDLSTSSVSNEAYGVTWDGNDTVAPSKNAVYDKIQLIVAGGGLGTSDIDTSAEIAAIVTDETGDGALMFGNNATATGLTVNTSLTITEGILSDSSIVGADIKNDTITSSDIGSDAVQASELDVADVSDDIAADIAEGELADSIIVSADIKDTTITGSDLAANIAITSTGAQDYSSSSDFKLPNGANPTTNAAGETAVDTSATTGSGIRFYGDSAYFLPAYQTYCFTITNATTTADRPLFKVSRAATLKSVGGVITAGTNTTGALTECTANGATCVEVHTALNLTTTYNSTTTFSDSSIDSGDYIGWNTTSVDGTINCTICWDMIYDQIN